MKRIVIIGAGPAGLTAGYLLSKQPDTHVTVLEALPFVGGMCRTFELWGHQVDLGPHRFFSKDPLVNSIWDEACQHQFEWVPRVTRILYNEKLFQYPIQPLDAFVKLGPVEAFRCAASYALTKIQPPQDLPNFESWVTGRFGRRLYEIFFKTYSEKLWGIPCTSLHSDFAAQRIKKLSLTEALRSALRPKAKTKHQTLIDQFKYPYHGTLAPYTYMMEQIRAAGGQVQLSEPCLSFKKTGNQIQEVHTANHIYPCDALISSMPLTQLVSRLNPPDTVRTACNSLQYRNTILVYLLLKTNPFPDNWIYVHNHQIRAGRITNFGNWGKLNQSNTPETVICLEYWANDSDPEWQDTDLTWEQQAATDLLKTGLSQEEPLRAKVIRVPKSYPIYNSDYQTHLEAVIPFLKSITNLQCVGRYGSFKYNNQDHSLLMGALAAENLIAASQKHDLWSINTDYDTYQETS